MSITPGIVWERVKAAHEQGKTDYYSYPEKIDDRVEYIVCQIPL